MLYTCLLYTSDALYLELGGRVLNIVVGDIILETHDKV